MRANSHLAALAAGFSSVIAASQGFNYGSTFGNNVAKTQSDFEAEFKTAQNLVGAPADGFSSARLYTMIVSFLRFQGRQFSKRGASLTHTVTTASGDRP